MDRIRVPTITEKYNKGNEYYSITIIKVISLEKEISDQTETRIRLFPITLEISYTNRRHVKIGIRLYKFLIGLEFNYVST